MRIVLNQNVRRALQTTAINTVLLALLGIDIAAAQTQTRDSPNANALPAVTVDSPQQQKQRKPTSSAQRTRSTRAITAANRRTTAAATVQASPAAQSQSGERANGPVDGYLATRSASGTKTDTPLIETPQSISIVTRDQIKATNPSSVADALTYTPGVTTQSPAFSRMADDFQVRGFNVATGNGGVLRDGLKLQSNVYDGNMEPYGLERIEVLKGAASVLYGQLTPGGVVNAVSKLPTATPFHEINVEGGSYDRKQISGDFSGPLTADGTWSYRLTGLLRDAENWVRYTPDDRRYIAPSITWSPSADTSLTLLGTYQEIRTRFAPPMPAANTLNGQIPRNLFIGEPNYDRYNNNSYTLGYFFEHAVSDNVKIRHKLRYFEADTIWNYLSFGGLQANGRTLNRGVSDRNETSTGLTSDTSIETKFQTGIASHTLITGVDYYGRTYDTHRRRGTVAPLGNIYAPIYGAVPTVNYATDSGFDSNSRQLGLYLQDQIKFAEKWVLLLGGRSDWADTTTTMYSNKSRTTQNDSAFTGRAGLVYLADNGLAPYLSYSQSFAPQIGADRFGTVFSPTEGEQYEAGIRYQPVGYNFMLSAAIYDLTQKNALTIDPFDGTLSRQVGEIRSRGLELEARGKIGDLNLIAGYAYTDARTTNSSILTDIGNRADLVPYHQISFWGDYDMSRLGPRGLKIGGGVRYLSSTFVAGYTQDVPERALFDAMASYDFGATVPELKGVSLQVNARNLFDKGYLTCVGATGCRYGDPRTVTASMSYRW